MMKPWKELEKEREELARLQPCIGGEVSPAAHVLGVLELGEGSVVLPGTVIEGHVRIGRGCRIGPNAYLRGETRIGDDCIIGNAVEVQGAADCPVKIRIVNLRNELLKREILFALHIRIQFLQGTEGIGFLFQ